MGGHTPVTTQMLTSKDHTIPQVILRVILTTALKQGLGEM